jgi:hypothetical protein
MAHRGPDRSRRLSVAKFVQLERYERLRLAGRVLGLAVFLAAIIWLIVLVISVAAS